MLKTIIALVLLFTLSGPATAAASTSECRQDAGQRVVLLLLKLNEHMQADDNRQALETLEKFIKDHPAEKHYLISSYLGNLYSLERQPEKALAAFSAAVEQCAGDAGLWQNHGALAWELKKYDIAARSLLRAHELNPDDELYFNAAIALFYAGDSATAAAMLEQLINRTRNETSSQWLETYISLCLGADRMKRALSSLTRWRPWFEGRADYWRSLALLQMQNNEYQKAVTSLKVHAGFAPLQDDDKKLLADLLLQIQIPLQAAELYEELLSGRPTDKQLMEQLIISYRLGLRPDQALTAVDRALTIDVTPALLRSKGEISFELGRYEQAFTIFGRLTELEPGNGVAYLYQGYSALRLGDRERARTALTRAARFPAEKAQATRILASLGTD